MRITLRYKNIKEYWKSRWSEIDSDLPMTNIDAYPLKYAIETTKNCKGKILEAGCGAGRILRYFHDINREIVGIDYIDVAIQKLKDTDPKLNVEVGEISKLRFNDQSFQYILAFGLYHNLEKDLDAAIAETYRVMKNGGKLCASFRADNIQTRLTDWLAIRKNFKLYGSQPTEFHKLNLTRKEFKRRFEEAGFVTESITPVENMPILYKFSLFRAKKHKKFDENMARVEGYKLSMFGQLLQYMLMKSFPNQFCNIYVLIAKKTNSKLTRI